MHRDSIKCHFLPILEYIKSHLSDEPMFAKLVMLALCFYRSVFLSTGKMLYKTGWKTTAKQNPAGFLGWMGEIWIPKSRDSCHNQRHTITFGVLISHSVIYVYKHRNTS